MKNARSIAIDVSRRLLKEPARKRAICLFYEMQSKLFNLARSGDGRYSLLDYSAVLRSKVEVSRELYRGNTFYGIGHTLKTYSHATKPIRACIEHGVYFGDYVNRLETDESGFPFTVTFSETRAQHILEACKTPAIPIGPYISYAKSLLSIAQLTDIKSILGRTLLVFPSHSTDGLTTSFDSRGFVANIYQLIETFEIDTVLVCLYYRDITKETITYYTDCGFIPVTCGRREDNLFLSRQRSLIELADYTASNSVGTHVGYCTALNKPHYIYSQRIQRIKNNRFNDSGQLTDSYLNEVLTVEEAYSSIERKITIKQRTIVDKFWGLSLIKSPEFISSLFQLSYFPEVKTPNDINRLNEADIQAHMNPYPQYAEVRDERE